MARRSTEWTGFSSGLRLPIAAADLARGLMLGGTALAAVAAGGCVANPRFGGPLPVRNQHPAQLTVLHLDAADSRVLPAGATGLRTDMAYTSLWLTGIEGSSAWEMDGELLRVALDASVGLGGGFMLSTQLPFAHSSGGFLDRFVIDYHELFGFPDQARSTNPKDDYSIFAARDGAIVWEQRASGAELLDVPLRLTWQLREPGRHRVGVALRTGVELPTGDDDHGYGNGEVDVAFGLAADYRTDRFALHGHAQHAFAGTPRQSRDRGFTFRDVTSFGGGIELPLTEELSALVQAEWETSTLRSLGVPAATRDQLLLWIGGRWQIDDEWSVEAGLGEDVIGLVSPDFTAWLAVAWLPGAAGS